MQQTVSGSEFVLQLNKIRRLVYLAPVELNSPAQRPHHFVFWAHQALGCEVVWVDPTPARLLRWSDWRRYKAKKTLPLRPSWARDAWLTNVRMKALPFEPFSVGRLANRWLQSGKFRLLSAMLSTKDCRLVIGRPSALALQLCHAATADQALYDVMDNTPAFNTGRAARWMQQIHHSLARSVGHIWCSASKLQAQLHLEHGREAVLVRNGSNLKPTLGKAAMTPPWVIGFVGTIASWFDWAWVIKVAASVPYAEVRLYGPMLTDFPHTLPSNVFCLPAVRHEDVAALMSHWHAGLIPFKVNNLTDSVDPVKYYEYRSVGLPVLSSRFGDMLRHSDDDGLWFLEDLPLPELPLRLGQWWSQAASVRVKIVSDWDENFNRGASVIGWI